MLISFSVRNFKSVKDKITLSFEADNSKDLEDYYVIEPIPGLRLLKLGLIYGPNGSGKTTILEALSFLRKLIVAPAEKKTDILDFKPFLFDENTPTQNSEFEISFVASGKRFLYAVQFNIESIASEQLYFYSPNKSLVYQRSTDENKQITNIEFGNKIKINKAHKSALEANTLWNNTVLGGFLKTNIESMQLKEVSDWFYNKLAPLMRPETSIRRSLTNSLKIGDLKKERMVQLLKKANFKVNDIYVETKPHVFAENSDNLKKVEVILPLENTENKAPEDILKDEASTEIFLSHLVMNGDNEVSYRLPLSQESKGTQRYFEFSGLLDILINASIITSIDEMEASLHPDLVKHFLLLFLVNAKQSQLIVTTHHRELFLDRDILRDDVIWFTEKKEDGSTDLYSLNDFDSTVVRDTTSVYNAYKTGKLGAVPELGDYYLDFTDGEK
ncbi:MAG TPA: ATP-binding protein [Pedobacter sp.]|uniref:AAA family ATPase n=1 Tax=Pedobacter sp. TaxID=1411316 RepID=UPI002C75BFF0|nr:ATP-binding protein [Pedobacter sp.]HMI02384.1 ATP-binding protein [Pedobacter sp.]